MPDTDTKAADLHSRHAELLRVRLCVDRQHLLPCQSDDIHRRLLSGRTDTHWPEQKSVSRAHSDQAAARSAMLRIGYPNSEREMLSARKCDNER